MQRCQTFWPGSASPQFRAAILPAAMRTVLLALREDDEDQDDDPDSWAQRWFRFAGGPGGR